MTDIDFGSHPFAPDQKKPIHVQGELIKHLIFPGEFPHDSVAVNLYISTDKFSAGTWQLGPGAKNISPDWHDGDEAYYILDGVLTLQNPKSGDFVQAKKGEGVFIPAHGFHKGYNFEQEIMRAFYITATNIVTDPPPPMDFKEGKGKMYKGGLDHQAAPPIQENGGSSFASTDLIGQFPVSGKGARTEPIVFYRINEESKLINVHGIDNPMLIKFIVSNDKLHVGEFCLPAGGTGPRASEPDSHNGDCLLFVLDGPITIFLTEFQQSFEVKNEQGMFIPEGVKYQLINYSNKQVKTIFSVVHEL